MTERIIGLVVAAGICIASAVVQDMSRLPILLYRLAIPTLLICFWRSLPIPITGAAHIRGTKWPAFLVRVFGWAGLLTVVGIEVKRMI